MIAKCSISKSTAAQQSVRKKKEQCYEKARQIELNRLWRKSGKKSYAETSALSFLWMPYWPTSNYLTMLLSLESLPLQVIRQILLYFINAVTFRSFLQQSDYRHKTRTNHLKAVVDGARAGAWVVSLCAGSEALIQYGWSR